MERNIENENLDCPTELFENLEIRTESKKQWNLINTNSKGWKCILWYINTIKILIMLGLLVYYWIHTQHRRDLHLDVISTMAQEDYLNITFYYENILSNHSNFSKYYPINKTEQTA